MASVAQKKLVVFGGNGFLGSRICKAATARGWKVVSISRSGEPKWSVVTSSSEAPGWSKSVSWETANILNPSSYKSYLQGASAVVHSMGILLEADYKAVVQGGESPWKGLQRAFSSTKEGTQNPLKENPAQEYEPQEEDGQFTYEVMNRDSAILLAKEAAASKVQSYVYISAAAGTPILPSRYISTKREAESTIASEFPLMRGIFVRPSFLYDTSRTFTLPIAAGGGVLSMADSLVGGRLSSLLGSAALKPMKVDLVGDAVVEALETESVKGPVGIKEIEELGTKAWRRGML